jgi:hypothetical protein
LISDLMPKAQKRRSEIHREIWALRIEIIFLKSQNGSFCQFCQKFKRKFRSNKPNTAVIFYPVFDFLGTAPWRQSAILRERRAFLPKSNSIRASEAPTRTCHSPWSSHQWTVLTIWYPPRSRNGSEHPSTFEAFSRNSQIRVPSVFCPNPDRYIINFQKSGQGTAWEYGIVLNILSIMNHETRCSVQYWEPDIISPARVEIYSDFAGPDSKTAE